MSAHWVEISQCDNAPGIRNGGEGGVRGLASLEVLEDFLDHVLGSSVRIGDAQACNSVFCYGDLCRAVDCGGG